VKTLSVLRADFGWITFEFSDRNRKLRRNLLNRYWPARHRRGHLRAPDANRTQK
jgi:hypothetical protein